MIQWIIEIDTPEDEALLMQVLPKFNSRFVEKRNTTEIRSKQDSLKEAFAKLTQSGVAEKYGDPSDWQREIRQDKPLAGRDL